ncbi:hypothetical protein B0H15DRAFT_942339 [Mycena belliarum]|uniref:Uncharacterized protein n=1 Tax=Mycena belliarum TaxID=1033014 RepID=A0AAD6UNF4_9AGAR|nr:hypothetical protein B0H15DRAFT_942339 [Mycena belliae]
MSSQGMASEAQQPGPKHRRRRTTSALSISADLESKIVLSSGAQAFTPHRTAHDIAVGAFTLTGSARASLQCFSPDHPLLSGEFSPTHGYIDPAARLPMPGDSPPASPACSFASIPALSRTSAAFATAEGSKEGQERTGLGLGPQTMRRTQTRIHPVLYALERDSRMGTGRVACAGCTAKGTNFPRCKKCSQVWCSRECRLSSVHRCVTARRAGET